MVLKSLLLALCAFPASRRKAAEPVQSGQPPLSPVVQSSAPVISIVGASDRASDVIAPRRGETMSREDAIDEFFDVEMENCAGDEWKFDVLLRDYHWLIEADGKRWPPISGKALSIGLCKRGCTRRLLTTRQSDGKRPTLITFPPYPDEEEQSVRIAA